MKRLANRYDIHEAIGEGGMGTVFKGVDTQSKNTVAIKQLKPDRVSPEALARFRSEGEALRDLNHPNIVKMLALVEEADAHYLILEYISQGDLRQLLAQDDILPLERTLDIALDLADALTRAHRLNIIHRDIKPANVLIASDGSPRLTDFGIARIASHETITRVGETLGTLAYMPPEAFMEKPVDVRADIWAFGVMLFEMITGVHPFQADTMSQLLQNILHENVPSLDALAPDTPIALIDLVYRMLDKDPLQRIPSVRIVGMELEAIMQGRKTSIQQRFQTIDTNSDVQTTLHHNLPADTSPFVGRETEIDNISALLADPTTRLVTIIAPGGMGKTRLSLQVAHQQIDHFSDGVFLVELAPLTDTESIIPAIAGVIGFIFQQDDRAPKQQLLDYLATREMLLILDNYEHLLEGADLVGMLLKVAPKLKIIVTSRQRLGQAGETLFHLIGIGVPDTLDYHEAIKNPAVNLFVNSAKRAQSQFILDHGKIESIVEICRIVQGMPLGIVLAASWMSMLRLDEIVSELQQGIDILEADDNSDIPQRQQSIRAVMAYSWQQMTPQEQTVLMKLSIFRGGFTREAAQAIAGANLRVLMSLVTKSLLQRNKRNGRYAIHEMMRQYAEEKLVDSTYQTTTKQQFAEWYADLLYDQLPLLKGGGQLQAIEHIEAENDNIHFGWKIATNLQLDDALIQMMTSYYLYTFFRSREVSFDELLAYTASHHDGADTRLRGYLLAHISHDNTEVLAQLEKAIAIGEAHADTALVAFAKRQLGVQLSHRMRGGRERKEEGTAIIETSLALYRSLEDPFFEAFLLDDLGFASLFNAQKDAHRTHVNQAKTIRKEIGDIFGISNGARGITISLKKIADSIDVLEEGLAMSRKIGNHTNIGWLHTMLSERYNLQGEFDLAEHHNTQAIAVNKIAQLEELRSLAIINKALIHLVQASDVEKAKTLIDPIIPEDEYTNTVVLSSVGFYQFMAIMFLVTFQEDRAMLRKLIPSLLEIATINLDYLNWYTPCIAVLLYETDPQRALGYLLYADYNQAYGSAWMLKSPHLKAKYEELTSQYPEDDYPELYAQAKAYTEKDIHTELNAMLVE